MPDNFVIPSRSSTFKFKDFVSEAISELIERGFVNEVLNPPKFINPLHVVQQSGGKCRLILDLSYLNRLKLTILRPPLEIGPVSVILSGLKFHMKGKMTLLTSLAKSVGVSCTEQVKMPVG